MFLNPSLCSSVFFVVAYLPIARQMSATWRIAHFTGFSFIFMAFQRACLDLVADVSPSKRVYLILIRFGIWNGRFWMDGKDKNHCRLSSSVAALDWSLYLKKYCGWWERWSWKSGGWTDGVYGGHSFMTGQ